MYLVKNKYCPIFSCDDCTQHMKFVNVSSILGELEYQLVGNVGQLRNYLEQQTTSSFFSIALMRQSFMDILTRFPYIFFQNIIRSRAPVK